MNVYERNLDFLKRNAKPLYKTVAEEEPIFDVVNEKVVDQFNYIMEYQGKRCFCHSIYNKKREMEELFKGCNKDVETIIIFGFGTGDVLNYIGSNFNKDVSVIVIEPNLKLFREVIKEIDLSGLFNNAKDVRLIINKKEDEATYYTVYSLNSNLNGKFAMVYNLAYRSLFNEYYESLHSKIVSFFQDININIKTGYYFKYHWELNTFANLKAKAVPIESRMESLEGVPVILVCAGPSLNKNIHLLKEVGDKALVVAVGSAIKILNTHGIVPHLRVAIDGGSEEMKIFEGINTENAPLLFTSTLYKSIIAAYKGPRYRAIVSGDQLGRYIYEKNDWEYTLASSGFSVSNIATSFLCELKCSKVIFIGQDLCFTEGKVYATGSWNDDAQLDFKALGYIKLKDMYGNEVYTQKAMMGIKRQIEALIPYFPNIEFINASEGGLSIDRTIEMKFQDVLGNLGDASDKVKEISKKLMNFDENEAEADIKKICSSLMDVREVLDKIEDINDEREKRLKKINKHIEKGLGQNRILNDLKALQKLEDELDEISFYHDVTALFLKDDFDSYTLKYYYNGDDLQKQIDYLLNVNLLKTNELKTYIYLTNQFIKFYAMDSRDIDILEQIEQHENAPEEA